MLALGLSEVQLVEHVLLNADALATRVVKGDLGLLQEAKFVNSDSGLLFNAPTRYLLEAFG